MHRTMMILWAAFAGSQLLIGSVSWFLWEGVDPESTLMVWMLAGMVAPMTLMSVFGAAWFVPPGPQGAMTRLILRLSFAESVALFGLVGATLGGPRWYGPALAAWGFVLVFLALPRTDHVN